MTILFHALSARVSYARENPDLKVLHQLSLSKFSDPIVELVVQVVPILAPDHVRRPTFLHEAKRIQYIPETAVMHRGEAVPRPGGIAATKRDSNRE